MKCFACFLILVLLSLVPLNSTTWDTNVQFVVKMVFEKKPLLVFEENNRVILSIECLSELVDLKEFKSYEISYLISAPEKFSVSAKNSEIQYYKDGKVERVGSGFYLLDNSKNETKFFKSAYVFDLNDGKGTNYKIVFCLPSEVIEQYSLEQKDSRNFILRKKGIPNSILKKKAADSAMIMIEDIFYKPEPETFHATIYIERLGKTNVYEILSYFPQARL